MRGRIESAARRSGRDPASIKLIAVSKGHGADSVREAVVAGQRDFGENYLQELSVKASQIPEAVWHYQGTVQRRKVKEILKYSSSIISVARLEELEEISKRATKKVNCLIEVNIANEPQKNGASPDSLEDFLKPFENVEVSGLMVVPPAEGDPRPWFEKLAALAGKHHLRELSMGMTSDFEEAIMCGATMVRIGTAIFGERTYT